MICLLKGFKSTLTCKFPLSDNLTVPVTVNIHISWVFVVNILTLKYKCLSVLVDWRLCWLIAATTSGLMFLSCSHTLQLSSFVKTTNCRQNQLCCFLQSDGEDAHQRYVLWPEGWEEAAGPAGGSHWHCPGEFVYVRVKVCRPFCHTMTKKLLRN